MKQNKVALIISAVTTFLSFVGFLCSSLFSFNGKDLVRDICSAIFSSAVFVVVLSVIGYSVEKKHLQKMILTNDFTRGLSNLVSVSGENFSLDTQGINTLVTGLIELTISISQLLSEYYRGLFHKVHKGSLYKDKELKELMEKELHPFAESLSKLEVYNVYEYRRADVLKFYVEEMITTHGDIVNNLFKWMEDRKFKMGKEFNNVENFEEYEKEALKALEERKVNNL